MSCVADPATARGCRRYGNRNFIHTRRKSSPSVAVATPKPENRSSQAFLRQKAGKVPKKVRKAERERRSKGGLPWTRHRFLRLSAISLSSVHVAFAQQPQHEKQWNQRKHEEDGTAAVMDWTLDHLWAHVHTEKSDHKDPKSVPQNGKRNDESNQRKTSPRHL